MQLSLKSLFGIIAFCAIFFWSATQVGFDNVVFWVVVVMSGILSATFVWTATSERRLQRMAPLVPLPILLFCCYPFASISLLVNSILLFLVGLYCVFCHPLNMSRLIVVVMACASLSMIAGTLIGLGEKRKLVKLRQEFPIVSLEGRLPYEERQMQNGPANVLNMDIANNLEMMESELDIGNYRETQLRQIHNDQYENFVVATGFGVGRMLRPRLDSLR